MEKEIINNKIIARDIIQNYQKDFIYFFFAFVITTLTFYFLCFMMISEKNNLMLWGVVIFLYLCVYCFISMSIINRCIYIRQIKNGDFKVVIDTLAEIPKTGDIWGRYEIKSRLWMFPFGANHRLRFAHYGEIELQNTKYYRFSSTFYMTAKGVCDRAKIGEDFYVVLIGKRKVPMNVYSTEFFTLKEEV